MKIKTSSARCWSWNSARRQFNACTRFSIESWHEAGGVVGDLVGDAILGVVVVGVGVVGGIVRDKVVGVVGGVGGVVGGVVGGLGVEVSKEVVKGDVRLVRCLRDANDVLSEVEIKYSDDKGVEVGGSEVGERGTMRWEIGYSDIVRVMSSSCFIAISREVLVDPTGCVDINACGG